MSVRKHPEKYLEQLKKYKGVILPDFSLYRDMPLVVQCYNIYRSRTVGNWLVNNEIKCIVNVRFGDFRTIEVACSGIPVGSTISLGSHGTMKNRTDRLIFESGLEYVLKQIKPHSIVIYGTVSEHIKEICLKYGTKLIVFESEIELANTIAHELNHARSFIKGENAPENKAYNAGDSLAEYIRGGR